MQHDIKGDGVDLGKKYTDRINVVSALISQKNLHKDNKPGFKR
jgi:hypothetical protein